MGTRLGLGLGLGLVWLGLHVGYCQGRAERLTVWYRASCVASV